MNSQQRFAKMLTAMIGTEPEPMDIIDSFELGRLDALDGKPFRPGQYERLTQQCEYALGYASVEGKGAATSFLDSLYADVEDF